MQLFCLLKSLNKVWKCQSISKIRTKFSEMSKMSDNSKESAHRAAIVRGGEVAALQTSVRPCGLLRKCEECSREIYRSVYSAHSISA